MTSLAVLPITLARGRAPGSHCIARLIALGLALVVAGCQTIPPAPAYSLNVPDGQPPVHAALRRLEAERLAGANELQARSDTAPGARPGLLLNRAGARLTLGQYAAAIADLQDAVRLAPGNASLRLQLARALWSLDREAEAREQVAAARSLAPQDPDVSFSEGLIDFSSGRWEAAATNFDLALAARPDRGHFALFTSAARRRVAGSSQAWIETPILRAMENGFELWPAPIAEATLGRMSAEDLVRAAEHPDPLVRQTWQTEVAFHLGELAAARGEQDAATQHYHDALSQGVPGEIDFILARARLRTLGEANPEIGIAVAEPPGDGAAPKDSFAGEWSDESKAELEINRLVRSGAIDRAILRLRELHGADPSEERLRMLASLQAQSGRAAEALASWRSSLRGDDGDWQAFAAIGWLELQFAFEQGTTTRNNVVGNALFAAFDPWTFLARRDGDRHLTEARTAFDRARALRPDDAALTRAAAQVHQLGRDFAGALDLWHKLRIQTPDDLDLHVGEAGALAGLGRDTEARPLIDAVLTHEPNHAGAHAVLAELLRRAGQRPEARRREEWAQFAARLPRGSRLEFTPGNVESVTKVATQLLPIGPFIVVVVPDGRKGLVDTWLASNAAQNTELLAAAWWTAPADDPDAVKLARELLSRGRGELLRTALTEGGNPVAVGAAAHALAEAGESSICDRLIDRLHQDQDRRHVADFAGALSVLGEFRAAMPLAAVLDPDFESSPRFSAVQVEFTVGHRAARARAALALAGFDSAYAKSALEAGTRNPEIALHCHVALFAQTKDPKHWQAIASALRYSEILEARRTFTLLKKTDDAAALAAAAAWEKRTSEKRQRAAVR